MQFKYLISIAAIALPSGIVSAQATAPTPSPAQPQAAPSAAPDAQAGDHAKTVQGTPATDADLAKGKEVKDRAGETIGTIESTNASGVVLAVGDKKIQVPKASVGKNEAGLFISVTRAELEAAAGKASAS